MFSLWVLDSFFSHLGGANHGDQRRIGWFPLWAPSRRQSGDFRSLIGVLAAHFGISAAQLGILSVFHFIYLISELGARGRAALQVPRRCKAWGRPGLRP